MSPIEIRQRTSQCLITYRSHNQFSQEQMAILCDLSLKGYVNIEQGNTIPSLTTALRIHEVTGMDLNTLTLPEIR